MASERPGDRASRLSPEAVARTSFATSFRGFDPDQVRAFLEQVATELRDGRDREATLRAEMDAMARKAEEMGQLDEARVTEMLGAETAKILTTARSAATEITTKAEVSAERITREANEAATRLRDDADNILTDRTAAAEAAGAEVAANAQRDAAALILEAENRAAELRAEAEQALAEANEAAAAARAEAEQQCEEELEAARERGREMVNEAMEVRARVLGDLARKRRVAREQVVRLQAGRERLLESYAVVRRTLDETTDELRDSLIEAKLAADAAARREAESGESGDELEPELMAAAPALRDATTPEPEAVAEPESEAEPGPEANAATEPELVAEATAVAEPPPAPEPEGPSSVTVGRRKRGRRRGVADSLPETELPTLRPPDPIEEVHIVATEVTEVTETTDATHVTEVAVVEVVEAVVVATTATSDEGNGDDDDGDPSVDVDDLFARLRADREEQSVKAQEVLDDEPHADATEAEAEAEAEPEAAHEEGAEEEAEPPDEDQTLLERRDAALDAIERRVSRKLKRVLSDEENDVLDRLRRAGKQASFGVLYPELIEHADRYSSAVLDDLNAAASAGAAFYADDDAGAPGEDAGSVHEDVGDLAGDLAVLLLEPLRERVETVLRDTGDDEDARADGVRAAYRDLRQQRLGPTGADTVHAAFNRGVYGALQDTSTARWLVDNGGQPCPDAEDNALAGPVSRGSQFPTGHCFPPAHPGCRCVLVPVSFDQTKPPSRKGEAT